MPALDADVLNQYQALTERAGVVPLPGRTIVEVTGADRIAFLHSFCTNDVKRLQPGQGCEAFITSLQGKTLGHVLIFCGPDSLVLETTPGQAETLLPHFDRFVISERIEFHERSAQWSEVLVAGPGGARVLEATTGQPPPQAMLSHEGATIGGRSVVLRRVPFAGPHGWLVQMDANDLAEVVAATVAAGASMAGDQALEMIRLEAGWPWFGVDLTDDNLPQEANRNEQAISFKKGCYLGQETVARIDAVGHVNRLLSSVAFVGDSLPVVGTKLRVEGREVGQVTSAAWSPRLNRPLALALVRRAAVAGGGPFETDIGRAELQTA